MQPNSEVLLFGAKEFYEGLENHELLIQQCETCNEYTFYPRPFCMNDFGTLNFVKSEGQGIIQTFSIVVNTPDPRFKGRTPFVSAIIKLDEGPELYGLVKTDDVQSVKIGQQVQVDFEELAGRMIYVFKVVD